jgi:Holliday junction resolvase RusA-like endonuclease
MKKKNLKWYHNVFANIDSDQFRRIHTYLLEHPFSKKHIKQFISKLSSHTPYTKWVKIIFEIIPEATPRPRLGQSGFYVKNSGDNRGFMNKFYSLENVHLPHITGPCGFYLKLYLPIPKSLPRVDTLLAELGIIRPSKRPDWDNLGKTYSDMIQPYILEDDAFIVDSSVSKYYSLKPRVEILLKYNE